MQKLFGKAVDYIKYILFEKAQRYHFQSCLKCDKIDEDIMILRKNDKFC